MPSSQENEKDRIHRRFTQYQGRIYQYCCCLLGNAEAAKDITQDVLIQALLYSEISEENLSRYLFRIAHSRCCDYFRRQQVRQALNLDEEAEREGKEDPALDQAVWTTVAAQTLRPCLDELKERERVCFLLNKAEGLTQDEIRGAAGLTEAQVSYAIKKAKEKLRACLERHGIEAP